MPKEVFTRDPERRAEPTRADVAYVRSVGGNGVVERHGWVNCPRRSLATSLNECEGCEHRVGTEKREDGQVTALHCYPRADLRPDRRHAILRVCSVGEAMTRQVLCVRPDLSLDSLLSVFVEESLKAVPVLDGEGALVGMVREADLLHDVQSGASIASDRGTARMEPGMHEDPDVRTVADVMSPLAFEVGEAMPITQAAALMAYEGVYHLVVRGLDGRVVGLLAGSDVLFWAAREDGYALGPPRHVGPDAE